MRSVVSAVSLLACVGCAPAVAGSWVTRAVLDAAVTSGSPPADMEPSLSFNLEIKDVGGGSCDMDAVLTGIQGPALSFASITDCVDEMAGAFAGPMDQLPITGVTGIDYTFARTKDGDEGQQGELHLLLTGTDDAMEVWTQGYAGPAVRPQRAAFDPTNLNCNFGGAG